MDLPSVDFLRDREWRLDHLYMIVDEETGVVPFAARSEQLEFRHNARNLNFVPKARKLGMSTEIVIENLDACIFQPNFGAAIVDKSEEDAWKKLAIARFAWENGPSHPDPNIRTLWREAIYKANPLKADSNGKMEWDNGSSFEAGVSFTGATVQSLHISEFGPIAAQRPAKALEIRRGSMNAVPPSGRTTIETTMEGGRLGACWEIFSMAKAAAGKQDKTILDWQLHFFSWLGHPSYVLPGCRPINPDTLKYFKELHGKYGDWLQQHFGYREVPLDRQAWWEGKKQTLRDEMCQQFPTVIDECDMAVTVGAIFPEMTGVRARGQINDRVFVERGLPLYSFWDLGTEDNVAGWLIQECAREINVIDWSAGEGVGAAGVADVMRRWALEHGQISAHFLPHDADTREKGSGLSYRQQLASCQIPMSITYVVPRTPQVWIGIDEVRALIPRMWFHVRCDQDVRSRNGDRLPSGVARLEGYRKSLNPIGGIKGVPLKDGICDHTADAMRTYAEAKKLNLLAAASGERNPAGLTVKLAGSSW